MNGHGRWLLPAGIEEILPAQARVIETARRSLVDLFESWGYELVIPPLVEYLESLLTGTGRDLDLQTFKLTDQLTGRMMGVRADMTPQVARIDAHHLRRDAPVRLCYLGHVLHTRPGAVSTSRSPIQVGAELYGHAGIESDVEILCLMLAALESVGVREVHLDVGHVGIFKELARLANLDSEQETALFDALQRKDRPEIQDALNHYRACEPFASMIAGLVDLNGGEEVLAEAERVLGRAGETVSGTLDSLRQVAASLRRRVPGVPVHFDLAELRGFQYHAGVVFAAFVPGHGREIARGGRYDEIGRLFGRSRPATGFSADLMTLVSLGQPNGGTPVTAGVYAPWCDDAALLEVVADLRAQGERVVCELPGAQAEAQGVGCDRRLVSAAGVWRVVSLNE